MTGLGLVACETLYPEIEAIRPDADVRYVPQEYHEFPVSDPLDAEISARVQAAVDDLDGPDRDRIVVIYATTSDGLRGVESTHAPLVVSRAGDCISIFTRDGDPASTGDPKAAGTYYLTRGWVDCAVDSYKLYMAYRGDEADLLDRFERAAGDRRVTWADGDRYRQAVEQGQSMSGEVVGRFFHEVVQYYDRVELLDTGHLRDFDREYAERFRSFVQSLRTEHGDGGFVDLAVTDGNLSVLRALLGDDPQQSDDAEEYQPGTPVA